MNKEAAIGRINKIGKIGYVIALIARIILIVGLTGSFIGLVTMAVLPKNLFAVDISGNGTVKIDLGEMKIADEIVAKEDRLFEDVDFSVNGQNYSAADGTVRSEGSMIIVDINGAGTKITPLSVIRVLITAIIYMGASLVLVIFVGLLCKALRDCASPFDEAVIKNLERVAWSLIPWAFIDTTARSVITSAFSDDINFSFGVNLTMILFVFLVFGLAQIFKYGALLQEESDETL